MNAEAVAEYRVLRAAQDDRYETATGLPVAEQWRQEYRDYFGSGDCCGSPVEARWTFRRFLTGSRRGDMAAVASELQPAGITRESARDLTDTDLAVLAAGGDSVAAGELRGRQLRRGRAGQLRRERRYVSTVRSAA